jgi:hypothetical protein
MVVLLFALLINILSFHSILSLNHLQNQESIAVLPSVRSDTVSLINSIAEALRAQEAKTQYLPMLIKLVQESPRASNPPLYLYSLLKMFNNLIKGVPYIHSQTFSQLVDALIEHGAICFVQKKQMIGLDDPLWYDRFKASIDTALYCKFSTEFDCFRKDPSTFLENLSSDIVAAAQQEMINGQLRNMLTRFLEMCLNKLIWNAQDQERTWVSVVDLSYKLAELVDKNVLEDVNDLDDCYWSLIHRYSYFLDIVAQDLHRRAFEAIRHDIYHQDLLLFNLDEQDTCIRSKQYVLDEAVTNALIQHCAQHANVTSA